MSDERKPQRKSFNSPERKAEAFASADEDVPVPLGITYRSELEKELWRTFTGARPKSDWLPHDLVSLTKLVSLEIQIREVRAALDVEGFVVPNNRGTVVENANLRAYATLLSMQLAVIRSLSINQSSSTPIVMRGQAKEEKRAQEQLAKKGPLSLIASR